MKRNFQIGLVAWSCLIGVMLTSINALGQATNETSSQQENVVPPEPSVNAQQDTPASTQQDTSAAGDVQQNTTDSIPTGTETTNVAAPADLNSPEIAANQAASAPQDELKLTAEEKKNAELNLNRYLEEETTKILNRFLPQNEFFIEFDVTIKDNKTAVTDTPYLLSEDVESLLSTSSTKIGDQIATLSLTLSLAPSLNNDKTKNFIDRVLKKVAYFSTTRGDKINFLELDIPKPLPETPQGQLDNNQNPQSDNLSTVQNKLDELNKSNSDLGSDLKRQLADLANAAKASNTPAPQTAAGDNIKDPVFWIKNTVPYLLILLALVIVALFLSRAFAGLSSSISTGLSAMAKNGGNANAQEGGSQGGSGSKDGERIIKESTREVLEKSSSVNASLTTLQSRVSRIKRQLKRVMNDGNFPAVLSYVSTQCAKKENVGKAVALLDIIDPALSQKLLENISPDVKAAIRNFMRDPVYSVSKLQSTAEVGEEIQTFLLLQSLDSEFQLNKTLQLKLLQLDLDGLVKACSAVTIEQIPRILVHLEPSRVITLLNELHLKQIELFSQISDVVGRLPDGLNLAEHDSRILSSLSTLIEAQSHATQKPFLSFYQNVIESTDESVSSEIIQSLSRNEELKAFVETEVVTFFTFFKIHPDLQTQILDSLGTREVASLLVGLSEEEQELLNSLIADRKREMIQEALENLQGKSKYQIHQQHKRTRVSLVKRLKQLKRDGELVFASEFDDKKDENNENAPSNDASYDNNDDKLAG